MKVSKDETLTQAFVLENDDLEKLDGELCKYLTTVMYKIKCKDQMTREFDGFSDFIEFENSTKNEIVDLRIIGINSESNSRFYLKFDKDSYRNIYISIEGNEETAIKLGDFFEQILHSIKPWYYPVTRTAIPVILWILILNSYTFYNIIKGNFNDSKILQTPFLYIILLIIVCSPIVILFVWLSNKFNKLYFSIFPKGVFAINQGLKRHKDKEVIRTVVVLGFIISFVSSLVVSLLFLFIT